MVRLLDFAEKTISKSCPYIAGGLFVGAGYWSAVTYGAITVMQVRHAWEGGHVGRASCYDTLLQTN